jgi:hypothetical protein
LTISFKELRRICSITVGRLSTPCSRSGRPVSSARSSSRGYSACRRSSWSAFGIHTLIISSTPIAVCFLFIPLEKKVRGVFTASSTGYHHSFVLLYYAFPITRSKQTQNSPKFLMKSVLSSFLLFKPEDGWMDRAERFDGQQLLRVNERSLQDKCESRCVLRRLPFHSPERS